MAKQTISYKEAIREIEETLSLIETQELDVDELTEKVKRVSQLIRTCKEKLTTTEKEIEKILKEMDGNQ